MLLWYNLAGERAFCGNWIDTGNIKPMMLNEYEDVMIIKETKPGSSFAGASTKRPTKATDKESHDSQSKVANRPDRLIDGHVGLYLYQQLPHSQKVRVQFKTNINKLNNAIPHALEEIVLYGFGIATSLVFLGILTNWSDELIESINLIPARHYYIDGEGKAPQLLKKQVTDECISEWDATRLCTSDDKEDITEDEDGDIRDASTDEEDSMGEDTPIDGIVVGR